MPDISPLLPEDPARLGSYTLIGRLGRGGFGVVYLAETEAGERVAVKLLQTNLAETGGERTRFAREAAAAKQVARFCTAQVLDADVAGDRPYIVSEYVPGPSLQSLVTEQGPLAGGALERLAIGTATALVAIHQAGVIHRDLKPPNVLIGPDGPRVIDFGIARMVDNPATLTAHTLGTPAYMAPEQVTGREITPAVDVFAWGATVAFAANGAPPFGRDTIPVLVERILHDPPDLGVLTGRMRAIVAECLEKDPARRPTASALLMRLLGQEAAAAGPGHTAILAEGVAAADPTGAVELGDLETRAATQAGGQPIGPSGGRPYGHPGGQPIGQLGTQPVGQPGTQPTGLPPVGGGPVDRGKRRRWPLALAGAVGAAALASAATAGLAKVGDHKKPPAPSAPPVSAAYTPPTTQPAPTTPAATKPAPVSHPAPRPTFYITPSSCDLGYTDTTCTIRLSGVGLGFDWTATATDPISISLYQGHLDPGHYVTVTITLHPTTPRTEGSATVTFTGAGRTYTVHVSWQAEPTPEPSTS